MPAATTETESSDASPTTTPTARFKVLTRALEKITTHAPLRPSRIRG